MSKSPCLIDHYQNALGGISDALHGGNLYKVDQTYGYVPSTFDVHSHDWGDVYDAYAETDLQPTNMISIMQLGKGSQEACIRYLGDTLAQRSPYQSFSFLAQGSGTLVMLGKSDREISVLRVSAHPNSFMGQHRRDDCIRSNFPGLLHGTREPLDIDEKLRIEDLPFVHSTEIGHEQRKALGGILTELTRGTCYAPCISEFAVLPDCTLMGLDPGECPYTPEFWDLSQGEQEREEARSIDIIMNRICTQPTLANALGWFTPEGVLKQDAFFRQRDKRSPDIVFSL